MGSPIRALVQLLQPPQGYEYGNFICEVFTMPFQINHVIAAKLVVKLIGEIMWNVPPRQPSYVAQDLAGRLR